MTMICVGGTATMALSYCGMFELIAARFAAGAIYIAVALTASVATVQLCRLRNDLL